ncbi:hypothetical protein TR74_10525 [Carbonactinospora thermoautotrophica]|uniref:Uncharacterized protein n=1 Tax=Carbonactinospora thermoautotrophica TaxID=1469144 RepID=A0A132MUY3_9ACTN|nr:hypothetical protein [Carbonactinospora thermoautotrophica]KWX01182.1 hypothetical protein LI90_2210 [Carbonactinospora thermoautotrophica]KWX09285.1 hypothetical protein TR74_10525 [Carbonactinospora thermoautotrophica]
MLPAANLGAFHRAWGFPASADGPTGIRELEKLIIAQVKDTAVLDCRTAWHALEAAPTPSRSLATDASSQAESNSQGYPKS